MFGNVFSAASTYSITGTDTSIDLYVENTTYYHNIEGGDHHLQTMINGKLGQINLDGPDAGAAHETTFKFQFKRRDTGQLVRIPWMQFAFFDLDENVLKNTLVNQVAGDAREAALDRADPARAGRRAARRL